MAVWLAAPQTAHAQAERSVAFNIPAGSLSSALAAFGRQAGLQVTYLPQVAQGVTSPGATGTLAAGEALARILRGSGLSYAFANARTVTISDPVAAAHAAPSMDGSLLLDTIDVTAGQGGGGNAADTPYETPGSTSYVSAEQISRVPPATVGDIFKGVPGVLAGQSRNGAALNVNIRGLQGMNRVKTTVDGAESSTSTYRGYFGVDNRSYVDPDLISGVAVSRGPTSDASGAGAIGGVVAMTTLTADDILLPGQDKGVRLKGSAANNSIAPPSIGTLVPRTEAGDFGSEAWAGSVAAAARTEVFEVVGAFARRSSGNYFAGENGPQSYVNENGQTMYYAGGMWGGAVLPGQEVFNTSQDVTSALLKATANWEDQSLQLAYTRYENEYGEVTPLLVQPNLYREFDLSETKVDTYTARYKYQPADNDLVDFRFNVWASDIAETTNYFNSYSPTSYTLYRSPVESLTYGADASNTSRFFTDFGDVGVTYGGSVTVERSQPAEGLTQILPINGERQVGRAFVDSEWRPQEWLKVDAGLSYDFYRVEDKWDYDTVKPRFPVYDPIYPTLSGGDLNPSVGLTVIPWDGIQLFGTYTYGTRPPSLREYGVGSLGMPNPELKPERSKNAELGVNVDRDSLFLEGDRMRMKFAYFNNTVDGYIARTSIPYPPYSPQQAVENIDKAKFSGLELQASYDARFVFAELGATYYQNIEYCRTADTCQARTLVTPDNVLSDYSTNYVPPKFMVTATLGARFFEETLTLGARVTHATERAIPAAHGLTGDISVVWPKFTTVDLFGSYKINENFQVNGSIENLTDRFYIDPLAGTRLPAPGRTARLGITAKF